MFFFELFEADLTMACLVVILGSEEGGNNSCGIAERE